MTRTYLANQCSAIAMAAACVLVSAMVANAVPPKAGSGPSFSVSEEDFPATSDLEDSSDLFSTFEKAYKKGPVGPKSEPAAVSDVSNGPEVIHERFPSRRVKIERYVAQDDDGNYYNQGSWIQWDEKGRVVARGNYQNGKRHGKWFRWYDGQTPDLFSGQDFQVFQRPFGTTAEFTGGKLDGDWKVFDAKKRPVCDWTFAGGLRDGRSVWYTHDGQVRQEVNFKKGQMDGELRHADADGKLVVRERYLDGRRVTLEVANHSNGQKKSQGEMLCAMSAPVANDDWWIGCGQSVATPSDLPKLRQGQWTWWHSNGQKQLEGSYANDQPVGKFTWWFPNGQCQLTGEYEEGVQSGRFVWWYLMGQKQRQGDYAAGVPIGNWMQWTPDGKVVQTEDYRTRGNIHQAPAHPEQLENVSAPQSEEDSALTAGAAGRGRN